MNSQRRWWFATSAAVVTQASVVFEERSTNDILSEDYYIERTTHSDQCPFGAGVQQTVDEGSEQTFLWCDGLGLSDECTHLEHALDSPAGDLHWSASNGDDAVTFQSRDPRSTDGAYESDLSFVQSGGSLYDIPAASASVSGAVSVSCEERVDYSQISDAYCKHSNIPASYNTNSDIVDKQCMNRCRPDDSITRVVAANTATVSTPYEAITSTCVAGQTMQTCNAYSLTTGAAGTIADGSSSCQVDEQAEGVPFQPSVYENIPLFQNANAYFFDITTLVNVVDELDTDGVTVISSTTTWLRPTLDVSALSGDEVLYAAMAECGAPTDSSFTDTYPYFYFTDSFAMAVCLTQADFDSAAVTVDAESPNYSCTPHDATTSSLPSTVYGLFSGTAAPVNQASMACLFTSGVRDGSANPAPESDAFCMKTGPIVDIEDCFENGVITPECGFGVKAVRRTATGFETISAATAKADYGLECSYDTYGNRALATFNGTVSVDPSDALSNRRGVGAYNLFTSCSKRSVNSISSGFLTEDAGVCSKYIESTVAFSTLTQANNDGMGLKLYRTDKAYDPSTYEQAARYENANAYVVDTSTLTSVQDVTTDVTEEVDDGNGGTTTQTTQVTTQVTTWLRPTLNTSALAGDAMLTAVMTECASPTDTSFTSTYPYFYFTASYAMAVCLTQADIDNNQAVTVQSYSTDYACGAGDADTSTLDATNYGTYSGDTAGEVNHPNMACLFEVGTYVNGFITSGGISTNFDNVLNENVVTQVTVQYHGDSQNNNLDATAWAEAGIKATMSFQQAQVGMTFTIKDQDGDSIREPGTVTGISLDSNSGLVSQVAVEYLPTNSQNNPSTQTQSFAVSNWNSFEVLVDDVVFAVEASCTIDDSDAAGGCTEFLMAGDAFQHDVNALCGNKQEILDTCSNEPTCMSVDFSRWGGIGYLNTGDCNTGGDIVTADCADNDLCTHTNWNVFVKIAPGSRSTESKWNARETYYTYNVEPEELCLDTPLAITEPYTDDLASAQSACKAQSDCAGFTEIVDVDASVANSYLFFMGTQGAGCVNKVTANEQTGNKVSLYTLETVSACQATVASTAGTSVAYNDVYVVDNAGAVAASFTTTDYSKHLVYDSSIDAWKLEKNNIKISGHENVYQCMDHPDNAWQLAHNIFCDGLNSTDCAAARAPGQDADPACEYVRSTTGPENVCQFRHSPTDAYSDVCDFYSFLGLDQHATYGSLFESQCALTFRSRTYYKTHTGAQTFFNEEAISPVSGGSACLADNDVAFQQLFGMLTTANLTGVTAQCQAFAGDVDSFVASLPANVVADVEQPVTHLFTRSDGYIDLCDQQAAHASQYSSSDLYKSQGLIGIVHSVCMYTCSNYVSIPPDAAAPPTDEGDAAGAYPSRRRLDEYWSEQQQDYSIIYDSASDDWTTELATSNYLALGSTAMVEDQAGYLINQALQDNQATTAFYGIEPPTVDVTSNMVCVQKKDCTDGHTCIVGNPWMADFDVATYSGMNVGIISPGKSVAVMQSGYFGMVNNLRLNTHAATTYEIQNVVGSEMTVTLTVGSAPDDAQLTSWASEVISIDAAAGSTGSIGFEVCVSQGNTAFVGGGELVPSVSTVTSTRVAGTDNCFTVTAPVDVGGFQLYQDALTCATDCGAHADCDDQLGAPALCHCHETHGYICNEATTNGHCAGSCVPVLETYDSFTATRSLALEHSGRMDHGWCITSISSYLMDDCSGPSLEELQEDFSFGLPMVSGVAASEGNASSLGADTESTDGWCSTYLNINPFHKRDETHPANTRLTFSVSAGARCVRITQDSMANAAASELLLEDRLLSQHGPVTRKWVGQAVGDAVQFSLESDLKGGMRAYGGMAGTECFNDVLDDEFGVAHGVATALECEDLCIRNADCQSFTFRPHVPDRRLSRFEVDWSHNVCKLHPDACHVMNVACGGEKYEEPSGGFPDDMPFEPPFEPSMPDDMPFDPNMPQEFGRRLQSSFSCSYAGNVPLFVDTVSVAGGAAATDGVLSVASGESFSLELGARHLPFSIDKTRDLSKGQRLKIVDAGSHVTDLTSACYAPIPSEVHGVRCSRNSNGYSTICTKKPTSANGSGALFGEFSIDAKSDNYYYNVCYCDSRCHDELSWRLLKTAAGDAVAVKASKSVYTWAISQGAGGNPLEVSRISDSVYFTFTISGEPDATTGTSEWQVKIVDPAFDCSVSHDYCVGTTSGSCTFSAPLSSSPTFKFEKLNCGDDKIQDWKVCFSADNGLTWDAIANTGGDSQTFSLVAADGEDLSVPAIHSNQFLSALAADGRRSEPVVVNGQNLKTTEAGQNMLALNRHGSCGDNSNWEYIPNPVGSVQCRGRNNDKPSYLHSGAIYDDETVANWPHGISSSGSTDAYARGGWVSVAFDGPIACPTSDTASIQFLYSQDNTKVVAEYDCNAAQTAGTLMIRENQLFLFLEANLDTTNTGAWQDVNYNSLLNSDGSIDGSPLVYLHFAEGAIDRACGAGNDAFSTNFGDTGYYVTLSSNWPSSSDVRLLAITPQPGKNTVVSDADMTIHFNAQVYVDESKVFTVTDCGNNLVCEDSDTTVPRSADVVTSGRTDLPDLDGSSTQMSHSRHFNLGRVVANYGTQIRRHRICFPDGMFQSDYGGSLLFGSDGSYCFELVTGPAGYLADWDYNFAYPVSAATDSSYTVDVTLFEDVVSANAGTRSFQACMCIANDDDSLEDRSDHPAGDFSDAVTMKYESKQKATGGDVYDFASTGMMVNGRSIADHVCKEMCELGCTGAHCACDSYEFGNSGTPDHYVCGQEDELVAACKAVEASKCSGLSYNAETQQAVFYQGTTDSNENVDWTLWKKETGAACTDVEDYSIFVGSLTVATDVNTQVRYVVQPEEHVSIEVTNANNNDLTAGLADAAGVNSGSSWNRVMVVDCQGQCGQAGPSEHVQVNGSAGSVSAWTNLSPVNFWQDSIQWTNVVSGGVYKHDYGSAPKTYCSSGNMNIFEHGLGRYSCFAQCANGASGDGCADMGYVSGQDESEDSVAICMPHGSTAERDASLEKVQYLCDTLPDCGSVDAHEVLGRYYLNTIDCEEVTGTDVYYTHHDKLQLDSQQSETTLHAGMEDTVAAAGESDWPFSMSQMLRYVGVTFSTGGNFKLCYCSAAATSGNRCKTAADFNVEVGKVHASGVSCLLADERMLSTTCVSQVYGGNRCYENQVPPSVTPPAVTYSQREAYLI